MAAVLHWMIFREILPKETLSTEAFMRYGASGGQAVQTQIFNLLQDYEFQSCWTEIMVTKLAQCVKPIIAFDEVSTCTKSIIPKAGELTEKSIVGAPFL